MTRPTTLTVLGILAIIFGAYGLLCTPFALAMTAGFGSGAFKELMPAFSGPMQTWLYVSSGLAIVVSAIELAAGIGMLQVKEWGRKLAIGLAVYKILFSFVGAAVQILMIKPMMAEMMKDLPGGASSSQAAMTGGMIGGVIGGAVGIIFAVVLYSVLIYLLTRPEVVTACQSEPVERAYAGSL